MLGAKAHVPLQQRAVSVHRGHFCNPRVEVLLFTRVGDIKNGRGISVRSERVVSVTVTEASMGCHHSGLLGHSIGRLGRERPVGTGFCTLLCHLGDHIHSSAETGMGRGGESHHTEERCWDSM